MSAIQQTHIRQREKKEEEEEEEEEEAEGVSWRRKQSSPQGRKRAEAVFFYLMFVKNCDQDGEGGETSSTCTVNFVSFITHK